MPFKNSEELSRDILLKLRPWLMTIPVPTSIPPPEWTAHAERSVRQAVESQLRLYLRDGILPRACLGAEVDEHQWGQRVTLPLRVTVTQFNELSGFNPLAPPQIQLQNLGNVAELVMQPLYRVAAPITTESIEALRPIREPVSDFVRSIMANVRNTGVEDDFVLDSEERALRGILQPKPATFAERRAARALELQNSLKRDEEAKKEAEAKEDAIKATGFGRLIDID